MDHITVHIKRRKEENVKVIPARGFHNFDTWDLCDLNKRVKISMTFILQDGRINRPWAWKQKLKSVFGKSSKVKYQVILFLIFIKVILF